MKVIPRSIVFVVLGVAVCATGAVTALAFQGDSTPTFGRIPQDAQRPDGSFDDSKLPDLIVVEDDEGEAVGYARKGDVFPAQGGEFSREELDARNIIEVWDSAGEVLVGHVFPDGVGYLSLEEQAKRGVSPSDPPEAETTVTTVIGK